MSSATSRGSLKVRLEGRGLVTIRPSLHIATGGEGSIYRLGSDTAVKIYSDPRKMQKLGIDRKIKLLSALNLPYIVSPKGLAYTEKGGVAGYHMAYAEGHPLSRVFTNEFWKTEGFTIEHAKVLVERMRDTVSFAHSNSATLVDANELNWLVSFEGRDPEPRVVDVDSWTIGGFKTAVIMPSIRDWHSSMFDEKSDWFSWGIVTFQVFTGLHPYKGTHPTYKKGEFLERMKANASVFDKDVRMNRAVRDFSLVPSSLLSWYEAVFQNGERTAPPSVFDTTKGLPRGALTMRIKTTGQTGALVFEKLFEKTGDPVIRMFSAGAVLTSSGAVIDAISKREVARSAGNECEIVKTSSGWLLAKLKGNVVELSNSRNGSLGPELLPFTMSARDILRHENRLFALGEQGLTEIRLHNFGNKIVASAGQTWSVMPNSTTCFDGVAVQDAMGAMFVILPTGEKGLVHTRVRELDGLKVVSAKAGQSFVSILAVDKFGAYQRIELVFASDFLSHTASVVAEDQPELNLAILPKGVYARIAEDGELVIVVPSTGKTTIVNDKHISTDMILGNFGDQVVYLENGAVWSVRMR